MTDSIFERQARIREAIESVATKTGKSSFRAIADELGVTHGTIKGWLDGRMPDGDHLKKLAQCSGYSTDYLLYGHSENVSVNELVDIVSKAPNIDELLYIQDSFMRAVNNRIRELTATYKAS